MNTFITRIRRFLVLSMEKKLELFRMVMILVFSTFLVKFIPLRYYYKRFLLAKEIHFEDTMQLYSNQISYFNRIQTLLPWKITCLMESIAMHIFFKKNGIYLTIYIGLKTDRGLTAHAWSLLSSSKGFSKINH